MAQKPANTDDLVWQLGLIVVVVIIIFLPNFCFKVDPKEFEAAKKLYEQNKKKD